MVMPRPNGVFTYDAELRRFRNAGGQLIPTQAVIPSAVPASISSDDALEMQHDDHPAGAANAQWLQQMMDSGLRQPCMTCGQHVGLGNVTLTSVHTRDWGKSA